MQLGELSPDIWHHWGSPHTLPRMDAGSASLQGVQAPALIEDTLSGLERGEALLRTGLRASCVLRGSPDTVMACFLVGCPRDLGAEWEARRVPTVLCLSPKKRL